MQGLADGYFILPYTIGDYLATTKFAPIAKDAAPFRDSAKEVQKQVDTLLAINGTTTVDEYHRQLGKIMWDFVGMGRNKEGLKKALKLIPELRAKFWKDVKVTGMGSDLNAELEKAGRVADFREKSSMARSNLASMGVYIFNPDCLARRLREDAGEPGSLHDFGYNILPRMIKTDRVFAYEFKGYWLDIGTVRAYYDANMELLAPRPRFSLNSGWPILGESRALPAERARQESTIVNSIISPGCSIKGRVENSVLSPGVSVAPQAVVKDSIVMANTAIGYHSIVTGCILDEKVNIGNFCYVGFGAGLLPRNEEITVLGNNVTVPDRTAIGRECRVRPGLGRLVQVRITEAWPNSVRGEAVPGVLDSGKGDA